MCMSTPSPPVDNSAAIARAQAEARERRVNEGRSAIDSAFGQFGDDYFAGQSTNFSDFYLPQVEDQFIDARRAMTLNLARSGNLNSGAGARDLAKLQGAYADERARIADEALNFGNTRRSDVETERNKLYQQNLSAADPSSIGSAAQASVGSLGAPHSFSPLGTLFAEFAKGADTYLAGQRYQESRDALAPTPGKPASGAVTIVR